MYDIQIVQSYELIRQSFGLCVAKHPTCRLEHAANLFGTRRKRDTNTKNSEFVCNEYARQGKNLAQTSFNKVNNQIIEYVRRACINDVQATNNTIVCFCIYFLFFLFICEFTFFIYSGQIVLFQ